jgi:DNA-binding transcriptional MocR family regulator
MLQYEKVFRSVSSMIHQGLLKEGDRIPSLRSMSEQTGTSVNTVRQAYDRLEQLFYIESVPQSGYYVRPLREELSAVPARDPAKMNPRDVGMCRIFSIYQERGGIGAETSLGIATLDPNLFPTRDLFRITAEIGREGSPDAFQYQIPPGYLPLREQLAIMGRESGAEIGPEDIVIANGCQEALFLILSAVCRKGDTVVLESPFYFHFLNMLEKLELNIIEIPATDQGISLDTLEFVLDHYAAAAMITVSNFSNPLGFSHDRGKKRDILALLSAKGVPLIEDDIYSDFYFSGKRPETYFSLAGEGQEVFLCSSFSKSLGPGMRIGWVWPGRHREKVIAHKTMMNLGASSFEQIILHRYLKTGLYPRHIRRIRRLLKENTRLMRSAVLEHFPPGTRVSQPEGGLILWVTLPEGRDSMDLYRRAQEKGILIAPGVLFSQRRDYSSSFRLTTGYRPKDPQGVIRTLAACLDGT